jgi:SAM-dependent methyltransferase
MEARSDPTYFDMMYRDDRLSYGLPVATPWDIGGPQPVIEQLYAVGAISGEVLDAGTGPGHHAIFFASKGYSVTGIDASAAAIERARHNARRAGVSVDFRVTDATRLDGLDNRFGTVVDCAFYHLISADAVLRTSYLQALHRATKPGARLFMLEFAPHNVNGFLMPPAVPEENFRESLPSNGWQITYLGTTTCQVNITVDAVQTMIERNPDLADKLRLTAERLRAMEPWLANGRAHAPYWEVHARRTD